jgi:hypothetical protein
MLSSSCNPKREKDIDELVLSENVIEKNGFYYEGECDIHAKEKFTGECKFYHGNGKLKGVVFLKNGLPNGHWQYWDSIGIKTLEMHFDKGQLIKKVKPEQESGFPWIKNITKEAIEAILTSIQNISSDSLYEGKFPTDIYNMPFVRNEKAEFVIVGYETSANKPEYLKIDFHPKGEYISGPRFTVEMNVDTEKAVKVYMTPDS